MSIRTDRAGLRWGIGAAGTVATLVAAMAAGTAASAAAAAPGRATTTSGIISTVAGGVGGPAKGTAVGLPGACGVASSGGRLYIGDNYSVREVSSTGRLTTAAGLGVPAGPLGDGGPAAKATFNGVCAVTVDHSGNLVAADTLHDRIRVLAATAGTFYGQKMFVGHIYTVAGDGGYGLGGDGGPATAATMDKPTAVTLDGAGNLVIADSRNWRVRVVAVRTGMCYGQAMTAGDIYTVAGGGGSTKSGGAASTGTFYGQAMTAGDIYTVAGNGHMGFSRDGDPAATAELNSPFGVAASASGGLLIGDTGSNRVRSVTG